MERAEKDVWDIYAKVIVGSYASNYSEFLIVGWKRLNFQDLKFERRISFRSAACS